jgi:hypothetical protein
LRAGQHLAPGITLKDLAAPPLPGDAERDRLASLYTPRGWQLQKRGKIVLLVGVLAMIFLVIELVSLMPFIWPSNVSTDPNQVLPEIAQNKPSIVLVWVAALVFALVGFMCSRIRPLVAIPVLALVIFWSSKLAGGFPGGHQEIIRTATERSYAMQVWLAFAITCLATGQGVRSWAVRYNKRAEETASSPSN